MEIKIRNLDATTVKTIDELANEKGLSRQEFLKNYLETLSIATSIQEQEEKYVTLVNQIAFVLKENTGVLNQIKKDFFIE